MKRFLILLLLLGALGAATWILMQDGADRPGQVDLAEPTSGQPPQALVTPAPAEALVSITRSEAVESAPSPASQASVYATPMAEGEGFLVQVKRKEGGEPIPFADVFFVDVAHLDQQKVIAVQAESPTLLEMIERLADRYRAGADGCVRLPRPAEQVWLAARKDRWFGMYEGRSIPPEGATISCTQMSSVAARVRDVDGRLQQDVPVQLRVLENDRDQTILSVRTNAEGIGLIQPLDMVLRDGLAHAQFALTLGGLLAEPARQVFDPRNPPEEPIELILPMHGALEVHVLDENGQPYLAPALVQAALAKPDGEDFVGRMEDQGLSGRLRDGSFLFRPVGLDQDVHLRAQRPDGTTLGETVVHGPTQNGELVHAEIRERVGASFLTGRVVHADGKPFAELRLQYELKLDGDGAQSSADGQIRTDARGAFRVGVDTPSPSGTGSRRLTLSSGVADAAEIAQVDLAWILPAGETQLGDVLLELPPLLVSGVVQDELGTPLPRVVVQARPQVFYSKEQFYWGYQTNLYALSGEDGSFTIRGRVESPLVRAEGSDEEHWCAGTDVTPGSTQVRVVMQRAGRVAGKVLLDEGFKSEGFMLNLAPDQSKEPGANSWGTSISADGSFEFGRVPPGAYRVEVRLSGSSGAALISLDGVVVLAGEDCVDPRLAPLDARGKLRVLRIRAVNERGQPHEHFQVFEQLASGEQEQFWANTSEIVIPVRATPSDLLVTMEGCLSVPLAKVTADCEVQLVPGPLVRIQLSGVGALPPGHVLMVGLSPASDAFPSGNGPSAEADASGLVHFNASLTGPCTVTLVMYVQEENASYGTWVHLDNPQVVVGSSGGTQSFVIPVNARNIEESIAQLAKQRQ